MGNKPKRAAVQDRRAKVEELRRQQRAAERRRTTIFIGIASVVGIGIIAAAAIPLINQGREQSRPYSEFGVGAAAAECDPVTNDAAESATHVETPVSYATLPPSSGDHFPSPVAGSRPFYTAEDTPAVEQLVHNLEHGYTILWYASTVSEADLQTLEDLADRVRNDNDRNKFIVAAWDESRGAFPEGKSIALSHWSASGEGAGAQGLGHRQLCGQVSGEVVDQFMTLFPFTDAPEPNAA